MKLALIGEAAPLTKDSGQVSGTQSNPGEFSFALAALLDLLKPPASDSTPIVNSSCGEQANSVDSCKSCLEPMSFLDETTPSTKDSGQVSGTQASPEESGLAIAAKDSGQAPGTQASPEESGLAMAAVLDLLMPPASGLSPINNNGGEMLNIQQVAYPETSAVLNQALEAGVPGTAINPDGENINSSLLSEALKDSIISSEKVNISAEPAVVKEGVPGTGENTAPTGVPAFAIQKESAAVKTVLVRETSPVPGFSDMTVIQGQSGDAAAVKNASLQANDEGFSAVEEGVSSGLKGKYLVSEKAENMKATPNGEVEVKTDSKGLKSSMESNSNTSLLNTAAPASTFVESRMSLPDLKEKLVQQIQHFFDTYKGKPLTKVQIKLEPEHLGQLTIKLAFNKGELNAQFYTENSYVKDILESSIQQLRETLSLQDMKLNQASVFVGDHGSGSTGNQTESGENRQTTFSPGGYSDRTFQEVKDESTGFEPPGSSYPLVNYLI